VAHSLEEVLSEAWRMIERGVKRFKDPFHWPVLGTVSKEGSSLRTVILRQFILPERILVCHTDARAAKVMEIGHNNCISWLFYHPKKQVQLRMWGKAELHGDDSFADEKWAETRIFSRLNYCSTLSPGIPVDKPSSGLPDLLINKAPTLMETEKGRKNFMSISSSIETMEWLKLSALGNVRARFEWNDNTVHSTWVIP
jgi:pyridoxamine 5'-phosphate oxidase